MQGGCHVPGRCVTHTCTHGDGGGGVINAKGRAACPPKRNTPVACMQPRAPARTALRAHVHACRRTVEVRSASSRIPTPYGGCCMASAARPLLRAAPRLAPAGGAAACLIIHVTPHGFVIIIGMRGPGPRCPGLPLHARPVACAHKKSAARVSTATPRPATSLSRAAQQPPTPPPRACSAHTPRPGRRSMHCTALHVRVLQLRRLPADKSDVCFLSGSSCAGPHRRPTCGHRKFREPSTLENCAWAARAHRTARARRGHAPCPALPPLLTDPPPATCGGAGRQAPRAPALCAGMRRCRLPARPHPAPTAELPRLQVQVHRRA